METEFFSLFFPKKGEKKRRKEEERKEIWKRKGRKK